MAKRPRKLSVTQQIMQEVDERLKAQNYPNYKTYRQFYRHSYRYVQYCRQTHDCRDYESCCSMEIAQSYCDSLKEQGYTASTIHTYLAALPASFQGIKLKDINKPRRHTADYIRGRKEPFSPQKSFDLSHEAWKSLVDFNLKVGLRKREIQKLTGKCFKQDESGYWAVEVLRGKGNKYTLNRLNKPEDIEFIRKYFERIGPDELVFPPEMFKNHLNLHKLRAKSAKEYYRIQVQKIKENPEYAKQLEKEILARWNQYNISPKTGKPRYFDRKNIEGYWVLRGKNRERAKELGNDGKYLKLAVAATSIFKLSHWRNDVTIFSYLNTPD
ncbi:MAG: hypothetical protein IKU08_06530 [Clostridia bacterium]|nr:hypothetical protein [Clostridia bacterium]